MIDFKHLYPTAYAVAEKYGDKIVADIKDILTQDKKKVSGTLIDSVGYKIDTSEENEIELIVYWVDYGDYVDAGRKPGGKLPPVSKIKQWVKLKGIQGRDKKGKFQSQEKTAWAIAKGIQKNGIEPTFFKTIAERNNLQGYQEELYAALDTDFQNILNQL